MNFVNKQLRYFSKFAKDRSLYEEEGKKIVQTYLYGINPVMIALYAQRRKIFSLYVNEAQQSNTNPRISNIINHASQKEIDIQFVSKYKLDQYCQNQPHQNVVMKIESNDYIEIKNTRQLNNANQKTQTKQNICVFLDQITDPQNLGAIIRTCYYLGIDNIVVDGFSKCPLTPTVSKTSAGAVELINIFSAKDSYNFLKECKENGWQIFTTGLLQEKSNSQCELVEINDLNQKFVQQNTIILLGSESKGVSPQLSVLANKSVWIDSQYYKHQQLQFPETLVDSLNVNAAASIILQKIRNLQIKNAQQNNQQQLK